jgi:DNA ligase-4
MTDTEQREENDANGEIEVDENADSASVSSDDTVEPGCDGANNIQLALICSRMENLWKLRKRKKKKKVTQMQKFESILPKKLLEVRFCSHDLPSDSLWFLIRLNLFLQAFKSQSIFPLLRLYCPDIDLARNYNIKERVIAQIYCNALGLMKNGRNYEMLYNFTDAQKVPQERAGDLSLVVEHVMEERISSQPSMMKVGDINQLLDELAGLRQLQHHHNHRWRETGSSDNKSKKNVNLVALREKWLRKVIAKGLSPLEHKWLVRIIMKKPEFGLRSNVILRMWSPYAIELYSAHNSLKSLCDKLANPEYEESRKKQEELERKMNQGLSSRWDPQSQPVILGNVLSPMLSSKLTFEKCMTQISGNHIDYLKISPEKDYLALKFPVVCAEVKLDGERMLVHVRNGKVTMHTRNGNWYSELYGPLLGSPLRRALSKYKVDVVLDGEVMAWDNRRKELVPFGHNRTVANFRRYVYFFSLLIHSTPFLRNASVCLKCIYASAWSSRRD